MTKYKERKYEVDDTRRTGYDELACAIIHKAVKDYYKALKNNKQDKIYEVERFFKSQWFTELCDLDADFIMKEVRRRWQEDIAKRK